MADLSATWERELLEQFSYLTAATDEELHLNTADITSESSDNTTGLLHLSDEVLLVILRNLDPVSLLRLGGTCSLLFRVCSCNSLWTTHFQVICVGIRFLVYHSESKPVELLNSLFMHGSYLSESVASSEHWVIGE